MIPGRSTRIRRSILRAHVAASVVFVAALILAACGGNGDESSSESSTPTPPPSATATGPEPDATPTSEPSATSTAPVKTTDLEFAPGHTLDILGVDATVTGRPVVVVLRPIDHVELGQFLPALVDAGAVVFDAPFRPVEQSGRYPTALEEVSCAIGFAREHAAAFGGDPGTITVVAHSTGSYIAALTSFKAYDGACLSAPGLPDRMVGIAGVYGALTPQERADQDATLAEFLGGTIGENPDGYADLQLAGHLDSHRDLQVLLVHGRADEIVSVDQTNHWSQQLRDANYRVEVHIVEDGDHNSLLVDAIQSTETARLIAEFAATDRADTAIAVFFSAGAAEDCSSVEAFPRTIGAREDLIRAAFDELVAGPTEVELDAGAGSFFSPATAGTVESVTLSDGLLIIDFRDLRSLIPNASTSCGSEALLAQLNHTAFAFQTVGRVRYRIDRSCDEFANWLQRECFEVDRAGRQLDVATIERATGSGCAPPEGDGLPDGRWFGFVDEAQADQVSFDLACWFTGTAAASAASEDGEESPPPNNFYIRNTINRVRLVDVADTAEVTWLTDAGDPESAEVDTYDTWAAAQTGREPRPGVWLDIANGAVVSIDQQYVP